MTGRTLPGSTSPAVPVTLTPLIGLPEIREGDDLAEILLKALQHNGISLLDGDILVVSSKVVSKAIGLHAPSGHPAEVVLSQTVRVVAERTTSSGVTRIVESVAGPVMTAAGVDASNTSDEAIVLTLPEDPDAVAADLRAGVQSGWASLSGVQLRLGVVLSDTAGRPWRIGQTDFALGAAGVHVLDDLRGSRDSGGRLLSVTQRCLADEIAAAADLVKGKTAGIPAAHVRGLGSYVGEREFTASARDLIRTGPGDWFAYGSAEAVRAALGVEPGSAAAAGVGMASVEPEAIAERAGRALRVALLTCPGASGRIEGDTIQLEADTEFVLGVVATRAQVALHGEGLAGTIAHEASPASPASPVFTAATGTADTRVRPSVRVEFR